MIDDIIDKIKKDDNYTIRDCVVDYIKEDKDIYLIHFKEKNNEEYILGKQYYYIVNKSDMKYDMLYIPNEENFKLINKLK